MTGRVLLVEDDDDLRRLLSLGLRAAGHDVEPHASSGPALRALSERASDVVVTDVRCPSRDDGVRVVSAARQAGVPVVVVSGTDDEADSLGADLFLLKPVDVVELGDAVAGLMRRTPAETGAVADFVARNAGGVLDRAVRSLESCSADELPEVAHRLVGTLGSFGLVDAAEKVRTLIGVAPDDAAARRGQVVAALRTEVIG